jgi:hypothetical protein
VPANTLLDCGTWALAVTNQASLLACDGGSTGDGDAFDDRVVVTNALTTRLADLAVTIQPESETIEDPMTEPVFVDVDFTGLGPGGHRYDVQLVFDVLEDGASVRPALRTMRAPSVTSNAMGSRTLQLSLASVSPPLDPGVAYAIRLSVVDRVRQVECASAITPNTFTIAP